MKPKTSPIYLVLPVIPMDDPIIHTDGVPFCPDMHCPCHDDVARFWRYCQKPYDCGLITREEQARIYRGEQIAEGEG